MRYEKALARLTSALTHPYALPFKSWANVLLPCVPVGFVLNARGPPIASLFVNFFAAIPLLGIGDVALERIASEVGPLYGALIYISTSNTTLFVGSISYLQRDQVFQAQQSLVGSLLANLLLLPALSIFYAAYRRRSTTHSHGTTRISILLLLLSVSAFLIPTTFDALTDLSDAETAQLSRGVSVLLIVVYGAYVGFQLGSHRSLFDQELSGLGNDGTSTARMEEGSPLCGTGVPDRTTRAVRAVAPPPGKTTSRPELCGWAAVFAGSTAVLYFTLDNLVAGLQSLAQADGFTSLSGLVLIPLLNCDLAALDRTEESMDSVIASTVGKSIQSALLIEPLLVIAGWGMGVDSMNLSFDIFQISELFLAIFLLGCLTATLRFNAWSHGLTMLAVYCIIAQCSWYYPTNLVT